MDNFCGKIIWKKRKNYCNIRYNLAILGEFGGTLV